MQSKKAARVRVGRIGLCLAFACLLAGSGCETSGSVGRSELTAATGGSDSHGYALLADLCGNEKDISKLRFFKRERSELKALLQEIASTNRVAYATLQSFAKADSAVNLKDMGLPAAELAARKAISKDKEKAILSSKGKDLELQVLLDQNEALTYGSHLASVTALAEPDPQRRAFLEQLSVTLARLQQKVLIMISSANVPPVS